MNENDIGDAIVAAALKIHSALGAGLLESVYEERFLGVHSVLRGES